MENIAKKIKIGMGAIAMLAASALPFTMQEFYNGILGKDQTAVQTDSMKTPQYEYTQSGTPVEMKGCVRLERTASNKLVNQINYWHNSVGDSTEIANQTNATNYVDAISYRLVDTTKSLDSTVNSEWAVATGTNDNIANEKSNVNTQYSRFNVFPNPSSALANIAFGAKEAFDANLSIYSTQGRLVRTLVNRKFGPGSYSAAWDGKDDAGRNVASGAYNCIFKNGSKIENKTFNLIR
jgi:flagellar hook assembly protein FlgD